ncbi:MAG: hypothetical protein KAS32_18010 [Candidatus Peribacteraceae bacterium]|nr:hypothetical protein [Candidatus Peribacteraceae bacterium]
MPEKILNKALEILKNTMQSVQSDACPYCKRNEAMPANTNQVWVTGEDGNDKYITVPTPICENCYDLLTDDIIGQAEEELAGVV